MWKKRSYTVMQQKRFWVDNIENHQTDFLLENIDRERDIFKNESVLDIIYDFGKKLI